MANVTIVTVPQTSENMYHNLNELFCLHISTLPSQLYKVVGERSITSFHLNISQSFARFLAPYDSNPEIVDTNDVRSQRFCSSN